MSRDLDLLVTLGGDGTMLRAARIGSSRGIHADGVPIVGVKLGRVSFLAEILPDDWQDAVHPDVGRAITGWKSACCSTSPWRRAEQPLNHSYLALNDVVVSRGGLARLITVEAWVDESYLTSYRADGVIVSTPTGCTGYALAAGGPILPPELKNILLIPICSHLSLDRPVVLSQGATVSLEVHADYPPS